MNAWLYTREGCEICKDAREALASTEFKEVLVDNPVTEVGLKAGLRSEVAITPLLVKSNPEGGFDVFHFAVPEGEEKAKFVKISGRG